MRYIILILTLLFSLSTYSQVQKNNEKSTIQLGVEGTYDYDSECLDNFENVKFNYEPKSFFWGIDDFGLDLYCSRENIDYNFSTFDGRFTINLRFFDKDIITLPDYFVTNKYERIVEEYEQISDSISTLKKYYNNGRLMLAGRIEHIEKRRKTLLKPVDRWYLLSENGKYILVGYPKNKSEDLLLNWRVFKNEGIVEIDKFRNDLRELLLSDEYTYLVSDEDYVFPVFEIRDEYGNGELVQSVNLTDNFIVEEFNLPYKSFPYDLAFDYWIDFPNVEQTLLNEKNFFVLVENGDKIKLLDAFNKLNNMND
tara:strand:- start:65 stop:994 length:930 start_codon:yes stop_codon:yes gene_type:complete